MSTNDYAGSAQEELSRHLDGIEGRINKFNNTVQEFWFNLISSDSIKFVVSAGTEIVSIVGAISDAIGELGTIMVAATGYTALYWSAHKGDDGNVAIKLLESIGTKIGLIQRDSDRATISISGFVSKIKDLWSTSKGFRAATIAGVAVAAIGLIYKGYKEYQEKIQQQADDATKKWSQESSTLKDYNSKYAELKGKLDSGNLSEEETLSIKKEILDIQYKITDKYGEQAKNIDLVNGSLEKQLSILQNISAEEAQETLNEGRAGYIKAEEEMTELRSYFLSGTGLNTTLGGVSKDIYNIAKKFEEAGVKINENASGQFSVSINATAEDVDKTINDVMSKVSDLKKKYKNDKDSINVIDSFLDVSSNSLNENKKILDNYYENYKSYLEQSLYAQGDADKLFDFGEAVDNYNDALLSGDTSKIDEAREAYKVALEAKNEFLLLEGNEKYSDMFDDISEQLDKATIKYLDFEEIVSGSSGGSSNNQFKEQSKDIKECADDIKKLELNSTDAFDALINDGRDASEQIWKLAEAWGITKDNYTNQELNDFIKALIDMGIVSGDTAGYLSDLDNAIKKVKSRNSIFNQINNDLNSNKHFDAIAAADETSNAGDDYVKADTYLNEAKEMYDKGLVGTDDFKTRAAYFSPVGSDDATNFIANYKKAAQYLTEDSSGVQKFLNDLSTKTTEAGEAMASYNEETGAWSYNIDDFDTAAQKMGMSTEFLLDMFGRLEDYGFSNNFASSTADAIDKINDKAAELAMAKATLAEMQSTGQYTTIDDDGNEVKTFADQTAIDAQREKIALLENDLMQLQALKEEYARRDADSYAEQVQNAKETYQTLADERQRILAENTYGEDTETVAALMEEQLRQIASDNKLEIDSELNLVDTDDVEDEIEKKVKPDPIPVEIELGVGNEEEASSLGERLSELSETYNPKIIVDVENENQVDNIVSQLEKIPPDTNANLVFNVQNQEQANALASKIETFKQESGKQFNYEIVTANTDTKTTNLKTIVEGVQDVSNLNTELGKVQDKTAKITAKTYGYNALKNMVTKIKELPTNKTTTLTTIVKEIKEKPTSATGTMLSPARASGTAYNMLNLKPAYANGQVALTDDEFALVNELGVIMPR